MDAMRLYPFATKIYLKISISRGMRAEPPEGGGRGILVAQLVGGRGLMEMRAVQRPYDYPSLWGFK